MAVENQSALNYSLLAISLLLWFVLYLFIAYIIEIGAVQSRVVSVFGESGLKILPFALGLAGAGGAFAYARKNEHVNRFGLEVIVELKKVVWPTRKEVTGTTSAVLVVIFIVGIFLYVFDKLFGWFMSILVS